MNNPDMRKRYKVDQEQLERLKTAVEQFISFPLSTPYDYERLSETIKLEGCGYVSATTLKRIWGYINDTGCGYSPSAYSLRTLCNLLGFKDMDEFAGCPVPIQSREYMGDFVESCRLPEDAELELRWQPNRCCVLRHLTDSLFKVLRVENSHLHEGDIVECGCFTQQAPAYFSRVFRNGAAPRTYIAGTASGITFTMREPDLSSVHD